MHACTRFTSMDNMSCNQSINRGVCTTRLPDSPNMGSETRSMMVAIFVAGRSGFKRASGWVLWQLLRAFVIREIKGPEKICHTRGRTQTEKRYSSTTNIPVSSTACSGMQRTILQTKKGKNCLTWSPALSVERVRESRYLRDPAGFAKPRSRTTEPHNQLVIGGGRPGRSRRCCSNRWNKKSGQLHIDHSQLQASRGAPSYTKEWRKLEDPLPTHIT